MNGPENAFRAAGSYRSASPPQRAAWTGAGDAGGETEAGIAAGSLHSPQLRNRRRIAAGPFRGRWTVARFANEWPERALCAGGRARWVIAYRHAAGAACCGLIATGTGAGMLLLDSVTQVSLTIGQSFSFCCMFAPRVRPIRATGGADVLPFAASAAVGQSPSSRTNGHKIPLWHSGGVCLRNLHDWRHNCGLWFRDRSCGWAGRVAGGAAAAWRLQRRGAGSAGCAAGEGCGSACRYGAPEPAGLLAVLRRALTGMSPPPKRPIPAMAAFDHIRRSLRWRLDGADIDLARWPDHCKPQSCRPGFPHP